MNNIKYLILFLAFFTTLHKHITKAAPAPEALDSLTLSVNIEDKKEESTKVNSRCQFSYNRNIWDTPKYWHGDSSCNISSSAAGVNVSAFHLDVSHGIHSITVEDIKYYFDSSIPDHISIPTVNFDLNSQHVLLSTPFGSEFSTPGMRLMDSVLSNDDGKDHFLVQGLSRIEKMAHQMHMLELWHRTSKVYHQIKANPPNQRVCSCLTDEDANGIIDALEDISIYVRMCKETDVRTRYDYPWINRAMPDLIDADSWKIWKAMLNNSMLDDQGVYHIAMYLYCKIPTFTQI